MKVRFINYSTGERNGVEWDQRYRIVDIEAERAARKGNAEYLSFVELGCGTAPLAAHLAELGYRPEASDYSQIIGDRLRIEHGMPGFAADCRSIPCPDNTYDCVLLAGTVYEHDDYETPLAVYKEGARILKPGGAFIHMLNAYKSVPAIIEASRNNAKFFVFPRLIARVHVGNVVKRVLNAESSRRFKLLRRHVHSWLYGSEEIENWLRRAGLQVRTTRYMQFEDALCRVFGFFKINRRQYDGDWAYRDRVTMVHPLAIKWADRLRAGNARWWGRSAAFLAVKPDER